MKSNSIVKDMALSKESWDQLIQWMNTLGIREQDLVEKFILGSGKGGQKINKTASCVYLKHIPSGIEVKCQWDRSRDLNRYHARKQLCTILEERLFKEKSERRQEIEKIRRQKRKRSKRAQEKVLQTKKFRSNVKKMRRIDNNSP